MEITKKHLSDLSFKIIGCAIEVHRHLGPGLLESVYEQCFVSELRTKGLQVSTQLNVPIYYKGNDLNSNLRLDLLIEDWMIVELKAVDQIIPIYKAQLLSYLKLAEKPKGLLINFNSENIVKEGLISMVTEQYAALPEI